MLELIEILKQFGPTGLMILAFVWGGKNAFQHFVDANEKLLTVNQELWKSTAALSERFITTIDGLTASINKKEAEDTYKHKEVIDRLKYINNNVDEIKKKINVI